MRPATAVFNRLQVVPRRSSRWRHVYILTVCGIIGTGLLAVPVPAGSGSYAIDEK